MKVILVWYRQNKFAEKQRGGLVQTTKHSSRTLKPMKTYSDVKRNAKTATLIPC